MKTRRLKPAGSRVCFSLRSAAAREFDEEMIVLAVQAHVRHRETNYDQLLGRGWARDDARAEVQASVHTILERWR
jgi:hypothetical protein